MFRVFKWGIEIICKDEAKNKSMLRLFGPVTCTVVLLTMSTDLDFFSEYLLQFCSLATEC